MKIHQFRAPKTWAEMIAVEPDLETLRLKAHDLKPSKTYCWMSVWYGAEPGQFKREMSRLAGVMANNQQLVSCEHYDLAYFTILSELPACECCPGEKQYFARERDRAAGRLLVVCLGGKK